MRFTMPSPKKQAKRVRQEDLEKILTALDEAFPGATCELLHNNAFELLLATILSAQCTDERVNIVTRDLFHKYRTPLDFVRIPREELEKEIRSTGFYHNKAKSIQGACQAIIERFGGEVPQTMQALVQLPGVARKTANVVLGVAFGKAEGIVVDTHVFRIAQRLGLTKSETPERVELDLMKLVPVDRWISFSHQMILHGRRICKALKPMCGTCPLQQVCPSASRLMGRGENGSGTRRASQRKKSRGRRT
jgi:endonuclease-3